MKIIDYFACDNQEHRLNEIKRSDWGAGQFLYELLRDNRLKELCGESARVLLLIDGDALMSFCTYAEQDDIREPSLTPWVGFVYTFPEYRGKSRMGKLLERAYALAKADGYETVCDGTNASDDANDRPGFKALAEYNIISPLRECGLTKQDIRKASAFRQEVAIPPSSADAILLFYYDSRILKGTQWTNHILC